MKIYSWNVNGIRAIQRKGFIEWIKREKPDILGLQETKANKSQLDDELINIEGYFSYFNSAEKKGYSGVAIYTRIKPISVAYDIGIEEFDREGRVIIAEYDGFTLLNIYFPNSQKGDERLDYKLRFYDTIIEYCDNLKLQGKKVIICGDFNTAHREIDIKNAKSNENSPGFMPIERDYFSKFLSHGYIDTFRYFYPDKEKYSWWSYFFKARERNVGWRIDYHLVSENMIDEVKDADILNDVMGSDHCPVALYL